MNIILRECISKVDTVQCKGKGGGGASDREDYKYHTLSEEILKSYIMCGFRGTGYRPGTVGSANITYSESIFQS